MKYYFSYGANMDLDTMLSRETQRDNHIIVIEVKASVSVGKEDFKHIRYFQKKSKNKVWGIVFYMGEILLSFAEDCLAVPVGFLID